MNKKPVILRSIFTLLVVGVFVAAMFPLTESDFYTTFEKLLKDKNDPHVVELIAKAKEKQAQDKVKYIYPSKAIEDAASEIKIKDEKSGIDYPMDLIKFVDPVIVKSQKLTNNGDVISLVRKNAAGAIRLGIDLHGGAEFLIRLEADEKAKADFDHFRDNAIETLRKRLEGQSIYESEISPAGQDLISVRVPVVTQDGKANLEKLILRSAKLAFRLVSTDSNEEVMKYQQYLARGGDPDAYDVPQGCEFLKMQDRDDNGNLNVRYVLVEKKVQMEGDEIANAYVQTDQYGRRQIALSFTPKGAEQFGKVTTDYVGRQLAIVLDGELYSAPRLNEPILGGSAQITGSFSQDEAKSVADALVSGSLPFTISIASRSDIDPTVGGDTVTKSLWSGIIGTILVMIFMIIYYRMAGFIADISLVANAGIMLGALAAFDVTLTLPGIAGIILTIGMAVDANVLIYERIREEMNNGKSLVNAVDIGFDRAFSAIFDSNITTLITALILFWQGTGAIKGFAMTLSIGIFTTLFTAVFLTRLIFDLMLKIPVFANMKLKMLMFLKEPHFDFIKARFVVIPLSLICIIGSIVFIGYKGKNILGIDFVGGTQLLVSYEQFDKSASQLSVDKIGKWLEGQGYDAKVAYKKITDEKHPDGLDVTEIVIRNSDDDSDALSSDVSDKLIKDMDAAFPEVKFTKISESTLGALVGATFIKSSIIALACAMSCMIIYMIIRFQFSYSIAANVSLVHDVIVSMGIYAVLGGEFTLQVMASLLTLIGYSVNDTIVTFDRQRENLKLLKDKSYFDIVNLSVNQTLARTILTSLSVVIILVAQLTLGGEGIRDFIAVMLIGCFVGCYSSIFISPLITAYWHNDAGLKKAAVK